MNLREAAEYYAGLGYPVFPCVPNEKRPATHFGFHEATDDLDQIDTWWEKNPEYNVAIATAGLIVIDIDRKDGKENLWLQDEPDKLYDLSMSVVNLTPRGGKHHIFREPEGKHYRNTAGKLAPGVDTRANGGYILLPPSIVNDRPYEWAPNCELDVMMAELSEPFPWLSVLLDNAAAGERHRLPTDPKDRQVGGNDIPSGQRNHALTSLAGSMRHVGMTEDEIYGSLQVVNLNRCNPPLSDREVQRICYSVARYRPDALAVAVAENHWGQIIGEEDEEVKEVPLVDPGAIPDELMEVPGLVGAIMRHTMASAVYPNRVLSFAGALSMVSWLTGRKVEDDLGNRTNLFVLGLAHSSAGKDAPRKVNTEIIHRLGKLECLGDKFASGEGLEDAMLVNPCMLFQNDEIDGMLQQINKSHDGRHEMMMGALLRLYSASNSVLPIRRKAGAKDAGQSVDQPSLTLFGTAIPNYYYQALSERMLSNGLFARMIILEHGYRGKGQNPEVRLKEIPEGIMGVCRWWTEFRPGPGDMSHISPKPKVIPYTDAAFEIMENCKHAAEEEYESAQRRSDVISTTVWGRVHEQARKLALIYACSRDHENPEVDGSAAEWATALVVHQTRRMLYMSRQHVSDNPFDAECLKVLKMLRNAPDQTLQHSTLMRKMKIKATELKGIIDTLQMRHDIELVPIDPNDPRKARGIQYRIPQ